MPDKKIKVKKPALKIGLALSGGGAKGFAQIAVIRELEKLGISFHCVAGTSMGALVGAWYATGKDFGILEDLAKKRQWRQFMPLRQIFNAVRLRGGLFSVDAFKKFLDHHLGELKIEKMPIPYCAIATSLKNGSEVRITSGLVSEAILASGSIPVIFSPVQRKNDLLTDGGLVNNFPVDVCFEMGADLVIGIDVRYLPGHLLQDVERDSSQSRQWQIFKVISYLMDLVHLEKEKNIDQNKIVVIKPYISHIATFDFERIEEVLQLGKDAFAEKEDEIRAKLGLPEREKTFWNKLLES